MDTDGDLILERCSRGCESSDDEVEHNIQKTDQMSNKYKDDLTRSDEDQELYVITLSKCKTFNISFRYMEK